MDKSTSGDKIGGQLVVGHVPIGVLICILIEQYTMWYHIVDSTPQLQFNLEDMMLNCDADDYSFFFHVELNVEDEFNYQD